MSRSLRDGRGVAVVLLVGSCLALPGEVTAQEKQTPGKPEAGNLASTKLEGAFKRRKPTTDEELRKQLLGFPEAGFDRQGAGELYAPILKGLKGNPPLKQLPQELGATMLREKHPEMASLPWLLSPDNLLIKEEAEHLQKLSLVIRDEFDESIGWGTVPDPNRVPSGLSAREWSPIAVPTITQMMQARSPGVRVLLVELLAKIYGKDASIALARRAIFDTSPGVRVRAVRALAKRPAADYTAFLYEGLRYPWPAAADHAAEAIVELKLVDLVPDLVKLLKEPSPTAPVKVKEGYSVREVVRINHLCNCMLCHAPSLKEDDLARGGVPLFGARRDLDDSLFIRADITYLRQDFSVMQPVAKPNNFPADLPTEERYDYLVRTRSLSEAEQEAFEKLEKEGQVPQSYPQQQAVVFALQELTGKDHGTTYESWSIGLQKSNTPPAHVGDESLNLLSHTKEESRHLRIGGWASLGSGFLVGFAGWLILGGLSRLAFKAGRYYLVEGPTAPPRGRQACSECGFHFLIEVGQCPRCQPQR